MASLKLCHFYLLFDVLCFLFSNNHVSSRLACICIYHHILTLGAGTVVRHLNGTKIRKKIMYRKHAIVKQLRNFCR